MAVAPEDENSKVPPGIEALRLMGATADSWERPSTLIWITAFCAQAACGIILVCIFDQDQAHFGIAVAAYPVALVPMFALMLGAPSSGR